ncbi:ureidoglycolate hydrolase [Cereibacter sphaeroides WS8N]|uniref:ureidoglycolate lyase n=1 Tax=Cereibacter sphaeroides TaxID=1063 RepID=UPI00020DF395|nr:ureidoglycolate lyase [Cereibacter sphaeroides]AZB60907.1 ureidoglycolate lyase [Cereibacter sphaeroides]EGJ23047.1 ureidoglycolate hydrolase [Cereibacter sphaeroides WS8N]
MPRPPIRPEPLTAAGFAPFGDLIAAEGPPDRLINQGLCGRWHDRARLDFGPGGRAGLSIFRAEPRRLPYRLEMVERHPEGSQAFLPMTDHPFLVIVAPDEAGRPGTPRAFRTAPGQGINLHRGIWHGVLTPLAEPGLFAVLDRIGDSPNLEEHWFEEPWTIED